MNLLISSDLILSVEYWYLITAAPSSILGDQSKLGGPEESLFERSPGIGREERPLIVVVVQRLSRFYHLTVLFKLL